MNYKTSYIDAVTRGEGLVSWQRRDSGSPRETAFRDKVERRKADMLACRVSVKHPVLLGRKDLERLRDNIRAAGWARKWFKQHREVADYAARQAQGYVDKMIPELTPLTRYTFVCPSCIGLKSQEGTDGATIDWDYKNPDVIRCRCCGQIYPSERYPETGRLACPRAKQTLTYYLNDEERQHPEDRSGRYAYHWVGHPSHVSFSGIIRDFKIGFMLNAARTLALMYGLTGIYDYARAAARILLRLSHCFRHQWLYHDYWDTVADCDPLYAAWHDQALPLEWKRNLFRSAYEKDEPHRAAMLQSYWGAGRAYNSTGGVQALPGICLAYDLTQDACKGGGAWLWTAEMRERVEKDLILEWVIEAEPFVGGRGKTDNVSNKSPRIYHAQAAVAKCLGIPELADTALRGYEAVHDASFGYDGFSHESPAYTNMYLLEMLKIPEVLHGFCRSKGARGRKGAVNLYRTDPRILRMFRATVDQLRPDGRYLPMSDTIETCVKASQGSSILEIALRRFPKEFKEKVLAIYRYRQCEPTEYALMHLNAGQIADKAGKGMELDLPEIYFPAWMTAILRHGRGKEGTTLCLVFNPAGGHRHRDNLSLYYADRGQTILGDQGYLSSAPIQKWIRSTFSHNLVIVNDQEQWVRTGRLRHPELRMMVTSPNVSVVEAGSRVYEPCRDFRRLVALIKGPGAESFAIDIFRVKGGLKHDYRIFSELAASDARDGAIEFSGLTLPPEPPLPNTGASSRDEDIFGLRDIRAAEQLPSSWQAVWKERGRRYRLWMLSRVDAVQASNGPGQETWEQAGRRVRVVDAIRSGEDLSSTFVAIHEPSGPGGSMPVKGAIRLDTPGEAGPDAVALRIESQWGHYLILNEFRRETEIEGVRFKGRFGILCHTLKGGYWALTSGASVFKSRRFAFEDAPASWTGKVVEQTESGLTADRDRPARWPQIPMGVTNWVLVRTRKYTTGFPVRSVMRNRITVERFPLPAVTRFELPAVQIRGDGVVE